MVWRDSTRSRLMPRYSFRTLPLSESVRRHALELAARRFPEVDVTDCGSLDGADHDLTWVCRAPNADHLRRWAVAADLGPADLRPLVPGDHE
jgi:hypothetical protein